MKKKKIKKQSKPTFEQLKKTEFFAEAELDFHEFGIIDKFDIEKILTEFIEDCYVRKISRVIVITGKGQVVRPLVSDLLKKNKYVESFKQAGYFNGQSGAFEVELSN